MNTKQHINQRLTEIKTNLASWEKWFGVRVYDQHKCAASGERDDTAVLYVSSPDTDLRPDWAMARIWLAGAEEVRNGDASAVGDSMNLSLIAINYKTYGRYIPNLTRRDGSAFERQYAAASQEKGNPNGHN